MINITAKTQCCGCNACGDICAHQAVTFKTDNEGFYDDSLTYFEASEFRLLDASRDYHAQGEPMTAYQAKFTAEGKPIYYAKYQIDKV